MGLPFRCSAASADDGEQMVGSAPADAAWLFVEYAGSWGRKALTDSRLPEGLGQRLGSFAGLRVQLIRRHGAARAEGVRVFSARAGPSGVRVETTLLDHLEEVADLDLAALAAGRGSGLSPHRAPLWLVCTNGRRDVCCAELGRPVAERLAAGWPDHTWETTHLGGHRFAATVLALPSGLVLGRLDRESAELSVRELADGRWPTSAPRGRIGVPPPAQLAEQRLRDRLGPTELGAVEVRKVEQAGAAGVVVHLRAENAAWRAVVGSRPGPSRRQSCGDEASKPTSTHTVTSLDQVGV